MGRNRERSHVASEIDEGALLKISIESLSFSPTMQNKMAKDLGKQIGKDISSHISSNELDSTIDDISILWNRSGFGRIAWFDRRKLLLQSEPYQDLTRSKISGFHCGFKEGLLEAAIGRKFNKRINVKEVSHCASKNGSCIFKIATCKS